MLVDEGLEECPEVSWLESLAEKILIAQGVDSRVELGLVIVAQERMSQLNLNYLGTDEPTDVLSFPMVPESPGKGIAPFVLPPDGIKHLGEVIISYPQAVLQAGEHRYSVKREIVILLIHGVLHLLGFDHEKPELEEQMRAREAQILNSIEGELE